MGTATASTALAVASAALLAVFPPPDFADAASREGTGPPPPARFYVPIPSDAPTRGPADAKVTIVEFADFQCPFCSRMAPTLDRVLSTYGDDVRLVFRNRPLPSLHPDAERAAEAAMAASEQGKFWPMYAKLFANQDALGRNDLERYAKEVGLDMKAFQADIDSGKAKARVAQDVSDAARVDAHGTPTFFINGQRLRGVQPFEKFQLVIDQEKARADAALQSGTPRNQLYDKLAGKTDKAP